MIYKNKEIEPLLAQMEAASENIQEWNKFHDELTSIPATLIFSMSELIQPNEVYFGYLWAWNLQNDLQLLPKTAPIPGLVSQLEFLVKVKVSLMEALLFASQVPKYGCVIDAPKWSLSEVKR